MKKYKGTTAKKILVVSLLSLSSATLYAADSTDLAKELSNPVANLVSVPFQFNFDDNIGADENTQRYQLNIQPVIPIELNENWNLISRTILPVNYQTYKNTDKSDDWGTGDIVQSLFFSPANTGSSGITWGVGTAMLLPTASEKLLGADQYGLGPTAVILKQSGGWTLGTLANHLWAVENHGDVEDVNSTFVQPFVSYTYPNTVTLTLNSETTYDWNIKKATIPVNFTATKIINMDGQLISVGGGVKYWAHDTDASPKDFGVRLIASFIFPK
ncbi:hypothetical protein [Acinetobacter sp. P8-3-8]|uniref:hypothetical protein n=1 Tax=Acinetobacter sp. P8-3-8 TaxID=1029823 RepID=UPI0002486588|nr:hypothetical protein [Acinetobacter sp. P8-3-8]